MVYRFMLIQQCLFYAPVAIRWKGATVVRKFWVIDKLD